MGGYSIVDFSKKRTFEADITSGNASFDLANMVTKDELRKLTDATKPCLIRGLGLSFTFNGMKSETSFYGWSNMVVGRAGDTTTYTHAFVIEGASGAIRVIVADGSLHSITLELKFNM